MLDRYIETLAQLASVAAQDRYIVRGTKDKYLLPEDLLENALDFERLVRLFGSELSPLEREEIERFAQVVNTRASAVHLDNAIDNAALVYADPAWVEIRSAAATCLSAVGFDLQEWERAEDLIT